MEHHTKHIITGHETCSVKKCGKPLYDSKIHHGFGKSKGDYSDAFVMSRILNHPELIFMNNPQFLNGKQDQFFDKDEMSRWQLSKQNECFMCDRHKYVNIFYERGILSGNKGLTEIYDEEILGQLKANYD